MVFSKRGKLMKRELKTKKLYTLEECFSLKDKRVVIVGGAGKMAQSFSKAILSAGCRSLLISDININKLKEIKDRLSKEYKETHIYICKCDVTQEKDVNYLGSFSAKNIKHIDVLIYTVMAKPEDYYAPFSKYKSSTWDRALKGNLSGAFLVTQGLLPLIKPLASMIFISSVYGIVAPDPRIYKKVKSNLYGGRYPLSLPAVYSASKSGIVGLSKYLATYLAEHDIRVNVLVPGGVYDNQGKNFYKEYIKRVPLNRMATWTDFNGAVIFLASDASRYMTGQLLIIDGGWTAW